ncbi:MAG TPA: RebB family R body protein [Enhygromyxa sp.]|jgi:hypothetical protein|nr:RebB family R body protein [Enhygromyxa sp.]
MADHSDPQARANQQVIDALLQTSAAVLGQAPAVAMASAYQTLAHAASMAALNAVHAQQQGFIAHQAATDKAVAMLLSLIDD